MVEKEPKDTRTTTAPKKVTKKTTAAAPPAEAPSAEPAPNAKPVATAPPGPGRARPRGARPSGTSPAGASPSTVRRQRGTTTQPRAGSEATPFDPAVLLKTMAPGFEALTREMRELKRLVQPSGTPPRVTPSHNTAAAGEAALEASVDSLRRLLSEAIEQRLESVVRELVEVRRELSTDGVARGGDRLERLLNSLGASRFTAEPMDFVDPLIHVVVEERRDDGTPDGVVIETVRPGYRTARGAVVSKAAVVVNRRS